MAEEEQNFKKTKRRIKDEVRQYVEKRMELLSLTIAEQVSRILAESFQQVLGLFILSFALFFFWFAIGFWVGEMIGNLSAGFAISALPLFLIGYVLMNARSKRITEKVQSQLISKVIDDISNEEEPEKIEGETVEQK
ncbi:MAG: phage holin family protein [Balneolaceae bacterium]|nr:phage holin family protein [Balneolaceae bacterium]